MTTEEKYQCLIEHLGIMKFHPFQNNYYATFAAFGDNIPDEIWEDVRALFLQSATYKELKAAMEKREKGKCERKSLRY